MNGSTRAVTRIRTCVREHPRRHSYNNFQRIINSGTCSGLELKPELRNSSSIFTSNTLMQPATVKRATAKRATVKRATVKCTTAKRATVKRATAKRATVKRATVKRATVKRATVKLTLLKKTNATHIYIFPSLETFQRSHIALQQPYF
ncbi:salivary glue protein Sgs-3-like [Procambarus clarkii]|uniref:salivary glue protein Sgs-3-like n=1 Tax=Procambarus clarkii TaxID=6728 RepID=UPI0037430779